MSVALPPASDAIISEMLPGFFPRSRPIWSGWPADRAFAFLAGAMAAAVVTALGDRVLNGPFEDWPASYLQFAYLFRGRFNLVLGPWGALHPLNRLWVLGFPVLCALLLLRRSPLGAEPS